MCGIAGFLGFGGSADELKSIAQRMSDAIRHRGPDDEGVWIDSVAGIGLSHRRLSIIDLSPAGHQPMESSSGRYQVVFNGEIYNFEELRHSLDGFGRRSWRGHSDTEVLLAGFEQWGIVETLGLTNGMFALGIWDREERTLTLARDRMGEKPLYYGSFGRTVLFGSELKALRAHPSFVGEINRDVLPLYFRHKCIPAPYSIYKNVVKLPPASYVQIKEGRIGQPQEFWSVRAAEESGKRNVFQGTEADAIEQLDALLRDAVGIRMISDVPLGAFLSGGIDSSTITALMQAQSLKPVRTFSIGFDSKEYNEADAARAVAQHLGTEHTELFLDPREAREVIPNLQHIYDEPFSDSSQVPTCVLATLTRNHVTVALSGDGGDEIFGGYNRHRLVEKIVRRQRMLPLSARRALREMLCSVSPSRWDKMQQLAGKLLPAKKQLRLAGDKVHKLAGTFGADGAAGVYQYLTSHWDDDDGLVRGAKELASLVTNPEAWPSDRSFSEQMMYIDSVTYLPDDILVKVDRATMAAALESRVPFLDHRVIEFAWQLPLGMKVKGNTGKWILREVLDRYVPRELVEREKHGFGVPIVDWLRGPLRDWAESLLDERRLEEQGYLSPRPIREKWEQHLSGRMNWQYHIWDVLMWESWLDAERRTPFEITSLAAH
jgi:asparagine synthase (glutamine-hydrolysing)